VCGEIHLLQLSTMTASPQPSFFCMPKSSEFFSPAVFNANLVASMKRVRVRVNLF
jgi:hypothetical protein